MALATNGNSIRDLRYERGLTYRELAAKAGVNYSTIWRIEHGERGGSVALLKRIADALGVPVAEITIDPDAEVA